MRFSYTYMNRVTANTWTYSELPEGEEPFSAQGLTSGQACQRPGEEQNRHGTPVSVRHPPNELQQEAAWKKWFGKHCGCSKHMGNHQLP